MLVNHGSNTESRNNMGHTPLLSALLLLQSRPNNLATVEYLVNEVGVNVNAEGDDGRTSLHHAARMGILGILKMLVAKGAVIDRKNVGGFTALNAASFYGYSDVVMYLLQHGADANLASLEGWVGCARKAP